MLARTSQVLIVGSIGFCWHIPDSTNIGSATFRVNQRYFAPLEGYAMHTGIVVLPQDVSSRSP